MYMTITIHTCRCHPWGYWTEHLSNKMWQWRYSLCTRVRNKESSNRLHFQLFRRVRCWICKICVEDASRKERIHLLAPFSGYNAISLWLHIDLASSTRRLKLWINQFNTKNKITNDLESLASYEGKCKAIPSTFNYTTYSCRKLRTKPLF